MTAILWQDEIEGTRYEVRAAGSTRRLYTGGVFHSQLNLRHLVTGGVWDVMMLPAFFSAPGTLERVALLGVGGGAVARQLLHFLEPEEVVGIDLNPVHLEIARRYFGLNDERVKLHVADAIKWMRAYRGAPFDLIIEDLYGEKRGEPLRAIAPSTRWMTTLLRHLTPAGTLVMNFTSREELRESAFFTDPGLAVQFDAAFELSHPSHDNAVGAFLRRSVSPSPSSSTPGCSISGCLATLDTTRSG
jgi:predicted membrane-bound spermidine synthase